MSNRIEDLEIYNLSEEFADEIWFLVIKWDFFAKDTVGKQLVRSSDSIGANIAEGFGRFHFKENKNFCFFSRGSIIETKGWLKKAKTRGLMDEETYQSLLRQLETIHLKLNIYIKFIGKGKNDLPPKWPMT
jgi:four helix bundle protein